jgi:hypothetical protein
MIYWLIELKTEVLKCEFGASELITQRLYFLYVL